MRVKDFKGRLYNLKETGANGTLMECVKTGDSIRVRNFNWADIGFVVV